MKETIDQIKKNFDTLMKENEKFILSLPEEERKKVLPIQLDINRVLKAVKKGDINAINEISKKYANPDTK